MRKTKYNLIIFEELLKNEYSTAFRIAKNYNERTKERIQPSVISKAIRRLAAKKFLILGEENLDPRHQKKYRITLSGLVEFYLEKRGNINALDFHKSDLGQEIIDIMIKEYLLKEKDLGNIEYLKGVLKKSPSSIEFFQSIVDNRSGLIQNPNLFRKISDKPEFENCHTKSISYKENRTNYFNIDLPLILFTKDYLAHQTDEDVKESLMQSVLNKNIDLMKEYENQSKYFFYDVLKLIKNNYIDINDSAEKNWEKVSKILVIWDEDIDHCVNHWCIYMPPIGEPRFGCKDCPGVE